MQLSSLVNFYDFVSKLSATFLNVAKISVNISQTVGNASLQLSQEIYDGSKASWGQGTCLTDLKGHDYMVSCAKKSNELQIAKLAEQLCGGYHNISESVYVSNCPWEHIEQYGTCKGFFAGHSCELKVHDLSFIDPCIMKVASDHCSNGFGSTADIWIVMGMLLLPATVGVYLFNKSKLFECLFSSRQVNNHPVPDSQRSASNRTQSMFSRFSLFKKEATQPLLQHRDPDLPENPYSP